MQNKSRNVCAIKESTNFFPLCLCFFFNKINKITILQREKKKEQTTLFDFFNDFSLELKNVILEASLAKIFYIIKNGKKLPRNSERNQTN